MATAYRSYEVPGGPRPLFLPAWIPVEIKPVNLSNVRSYEKWDKTMTTVHDTGNPRTKADGEYSWLAAGRPGGSTGGYEWINDDTKIIITGWFDETTWAQGVRDGNRRSHAGELAYGGNTVWTTALEVACAMHGAVLEMEDRIAEANAVLHQFWTQKWCAGQILNRGIWTTVRAKIIAYANAARTARNGGDVETPGDAYAPRSIPIVSGKPWDGLEDVTINSVKFEAQKTTGKTTINLNQRQWASSESLAVGPTIPADTTVNLLGWVAGELVDGISEWWIDETGGRLWAGGIDVEPKIDPDFGQGPEDIPGVRVVNGRSYFTLNDEKTGEQGREISIARDGNLRRWADPTSAITGTVESGDKVICGWWTRGVEVDLDMKDHQGNVVTVPESIWYVSGNDIGAGNRFWAGLSTERPD